MEQLRHRARQLGAQLRKAKRRVRNLNRRRRQVRREIAALRRQRQFVDALERRGVRYAKPIVEEAASQGLPLDKALALCEQESAFRHIFGCDAGSGTQVTGCNTEVTRARCEALLRHVRNGGTSNGVSLTQLTSAGFLYDAEAEGGLDEIRPGLRVGFDHLEYLHAKYKDWRGWGAFNGGEGNPIRSYADSCIAREKRWAGVLAAIREGPER